MSDKICKNSASSISGLFRTIKRQNDLDFLKSNMFYIKQISQQLVDTKIFDHTTAKHSTAYTHALKQGFNRIIIHLHIFRAFFVVWAKTLL